MKKKTTLPALLVLAMILLLTACGPKGDGAGSASASGSGSASGETELVVNVLEESGTASNAAGEKMEYSYAVPKLNAETPGAVSINQGIGEAVGGYVDEALLMIKNGEAVDLTRVSWQAHTNENLLSLVVKAEYSDTSAAYYTYNYDTEGGKELNNADLLTYLKKDAKDFELALRRATAMEFDRQAMLLEEEVFDAVQVMRMDAISAANLSLDNIAIFVQDMQMQVAVKMPTPAAGGSDSKVVTPLFQPEQEPVKKTVERGFVVAELENNAVTITFKKTETSDRYMHAVVEYDKPYVVEGLYSNYTDIALGVLGQDFIPYLFLTDENGQVSFCNIMGCMNAGSRFVAAGPMALPEAVTGYEDFNDGTANTMLALLKSGKKADLSDYTGPVEQYVMLPLAASSWSSAEGGTYWMDVENGGDYPMIWGEIGAAAPTSHAWIAYVGMTEQGSIYRFVGNTPDGSKTGGYLTLSRDPFHADGHGEFRVEVNVASGQPLPGVPVGSTLSMTRSFG